MNNRSGTQISDDKSSGHPIAVVSARTGLSQHVLRMWEKRYAAVRPARSAGGQRIYTDEQVRRLRLLGSATRHGRTIGAVAGLATDELARIAAEDEAELAAAPARGVAESELANAVDSAVATVVALDGVAFDAQLRRLIAREGARWFLERFVPTLMRAVGDGWASGLYSIAHEHLASAAVLTIILDSIRATPAESSAPRVVVATPSGEQHAVGAALAAAASSLDGWTIVYLGTNIPAAEIAAAAAATDARAVALSIVYVEDAESVRHEIRALRLGMRADVPLMLGGALAAEVAAGVASELPGIALCTGLQSLRAELAREAALG